MSSAPTNSRHQVCSHCGATSQSWQSRCWLCGEPLPAGAEPSAEQPPITPQVVPEAGEHSFALSTLMLFVTLAAVCCGVIAAAPGLGIPLVLISILALTRTWIVGRRTARKSSLDATGKVASFVQSVAVVLLALAAAAIAFLGACWTTCFAVAVVSPGSDVSAIAGILVGVGAAVMAAFVLFRATLPHS